MDNQDYKPDVNTIENSSDANGNGYIPQDANPAPEDRAEASYAGAAHRPADPGMIVIGPADDSGARPEYTERPHAEAPFYNETIVSIPGKKKMRWGAKIAVIAVVCAVGAAAVGVGAGIGVGYLRNRVFSPNSASGGSGGANQAAASADAVSSTTTPSQITFADVFAAVSPAVVSINTYTQQASYFSANAQPTLTGAGSGMIFYETDLNVYILTNYHVISGASGVTVSFGDADPVNATSVGNDSLSDVAVICVAKADMAAAGITDYAVAALGDSDQMQIGDPVMAIGNAMDEGTSATTGIVSGVNKEIPVQNRTLYAIQTNAAINPGNSGGPLVNMRGQVIGMNTAKLSSDSSMGNATVEGMGYAMTSNVIKPIVEDIMQQKQHAFLGIQGEDMPQDLADQAGIPAVGVYVDGVLDGTSAASAGVQAGDIITSFNGKTIFNMQQLQDAIKGCQVGDVVDMKVLRNGTTSLTLKVKLTAYQDNSNF